MTTRNLKPRSVKTKFTGDSLTRQSERTKADINEIVKRGIIPPDPNQLQFGDFTTGFDFQQAQDAIASVQSQFDSLPSDMRYQFRNSPANLLDFLADPENHDKAVELGLRVPEEIEDKVQDKSNPDLKIKDEKSTKNTGSDSENTDSRSNNTDSSTNKNSDR